MRRSLVCSPAFLFALLIFSISQCRAGVPTSKADPASIEKFEKEIRPILANRCQECHGATKQKGGLRLDSQGFALAGGNSGPAVVPGKPAESLLVDAINHGELFQMPPKSKLPAKEIDSLTNWIKDGAHWGYEAEKPNSANANVARPSQKEDGPSEMVKERSRHWSFLPIREVQPPTVDSDDANWPRTGLDRFILDALKRHKLHPAPEADRHTLIRRLSFDLTGTPPTPNEIETYLADRNPDAYERLVDRLLASPAYGERWGRHWLDLVRYADTYGHEFDIDILNAYGYRDYVIRALNADLPYDKFVVEQVAGDLLPNPRRNSTTGSNESILGTGFYFLGEGTHSPVDVREEETRRVDNQIDVFSKTFLGLTVGCARCHDHKFDPITTRDYYALAGFLKSSRHQQAFIDSPENRASTLVKLRELKSAIGKLLLSAVPLLPEKLGAGISAALARRDGDDWDAAPARSSDASARPIPGGPIVFEAFRGKSFDGWSVTGDAFGEGPTREGEFILEWNPKSPSTPDWRIQPVKAGVAHSGLLSNGFQGVLRSPSFPITRRFVHLLASGDRGRINIVIDRFEKIRDPIYGQLTVPINGGRPGDQKWISRDLSMWAGQSAYLELADGSAVDFTVNQTHSVPGDGFLAVREVVFSDESNPPVESNGSTPPISLEAVLATLDKAKSPLFKQLTTLLSDYRDRAENVPQPTFALAIMDGTPEDEFVLIRGNHKNPGGVVHRRILEVLGGPDAPTFSSTSGRLELAKQLVDTKNPLVARVIVNRLWKHHFGVGLVKTVDDFGAMGQKPSHPELLDWLARQFVAHGWSLKAMHRLMVTSSTYRMDSVPEPEAERIDPTNTYLHRMNVRRLEGETIRDALISVAGGLDETMYGPAVPVHLTPFMDGRGRPGSSGPLDGDGRRSIYLSVRRNFLNPMFAAFDAPAPFSTMGRRNVSNVPAQALTLLNDPLILTQAKRWAERILAEPGLDDPQRIDRLYTEAFGRPPTQAELRASSSFLANRDKNGSSTAVSDQESRKLRAWADLCHVLINVKEFIYVE